MRRDPVCVPPDVAPLRALEIMRSFGIGALPVVQDGQLVGLITEHDFMNVAGVLLLQQLTEPTSRPVSRRTWDGSGRRGYRRPDERVRSGWPAGTGSACAICSTSSARTLRPCAQAGRPGIWPRTSWPATGGPTACPGWSSTGSTGGPSESVWGRRSARTRSWSPACGRGRRAGRRWRCRGSTALGNTHEFFVHFEDVRRAETGWTARELDEPAEADLWKVLGFFKGRAFKAAPVGVVLQRPDGTQLRAASGDTTVTVTGPPGELLLYAFGREDHALVDLDGAPEALAALAATERSW